MGNAREYTLNNIILWSEFDVVNHMLITIVMRFVLVQFPLNTCKSCACLYTCQIICYLNKLFICFKRVYIILS